MRARSTLTGVLYAGLMVGGCVTVFPRPYAPLVQPPPVDQAAFERDFAACRAQVVADPGLFSPSGDVLDVEGAPTDIVSSAAVLGQFAWVMVRQPAHASAVRSRTEQGIQAAMTACLQQKGHTVVAWELARGGTAASRLQTPTRAAPSPAPAAAPQQ